MELPKTLITENTLTTTVSFIEITSGIDASYNAYEFLVMNGRANTSNGWTNFYIGQLGNYYIRYNSIARFGNNQYWNSYLGPHITNVGGGNVLLRAVFSRPSGTSHFKTAFVHGGGNYFNNTYSSGIVLAETTQYTAAVDRVRFAVSGGSWVAGTMYKLYGYE